MLAAGHDIGLGTFRTADFMVTNPLASEAIFDFGIVPASNEGVGMLATSSDGFASRSVSSDGVGSNLGYDEQLQ